MCSLLFTTPNYFSQTPARNNSASIAGRVTLAGKGVADLTVIATTATAFDGRAVGQAKTDQEGNYRIEGLPSGSFRLVPISQPYALVTAEGPFELRGQTINLTEGETADHVNFQLARGGVITGRITDSEGNPVIGERITVTKTSTPDEPWFYETERYRTDDRGIYRIFALEAGDYRVSVGQETPSAVNSMMARFGSLYTKTYYPGTTKQSEARILQLKEGAELSNIDLVVGKLPPGFTISGRVIDNAGQPLPNVSVGYSLVEGKRQWMGSMNTIIPNTDANGKFRADGIHPGKYGAFAMGGVGRPSALYSELSKFEVIDADVTDIVIKLSPGATISGVAVVENSSDPVVVQGLQSIQLLAHSESPERFGAPSVAMSQILADGAFTFSGLGPGKVRIQIQRYPRRPKGFNLVRLELDGVVQDGIEVTSGADIKNVRLVFNYGSGSLRGRVKTEGGSLPQGTRLYITLTQPGREMQTFRQHIEVDARGQFFADNVPPGTYELKTRIVSGRENLSRITPVTREVTINHDVESDVTIVLNLTPGNEMP